MGRSKNPFSLFTWILLCVVMLGATHLKSYWNTHHVLEWDAFSYYLYLPSVFIYDDLETLHYLQEAFFEVYQSPVSGYASPLPGGEGVILKTSMGLAGMYLPFFVLGHLFALLSSFPADGFSLPYQYAITLGAIFYAILGLGVMRKVLLYFFSDKVVAIALGVLVLGSNYLHYVAFKGGEAHGVLFTLYALLFWFTIRWHRRPKKPEALAIGAVVGLITLIRPTDIVCLLIPLLWGVANSASLLRKVAFLQLHWSEVLIAAGAMILTGLPQLLYWKIYSGQWLYYSYDEQGFDFLHPHLLDGLFSWHKGWLIYTPVMAFALLGFIPLYRQHKQVFWAILAYVLVNLYIVFSWEAWSYGGGFGARPLVQSYAALLFPLAALFSWLWQSRWRSIAGFALAGLFVAHNLLFTWHANARQGGLVTEQMNRPYYYHLLGHLRVARDARKLLDAPRVLRSTRHMKSRTLYAEDFEDIPLPQRDDRHPYAGAFSCRVDPEHPATPVFRLSMEEMAPKTGSWLRLSARVYYEHREWDIWRQPSLTVQFRKDGLPHERNQIRVYWLTEANQWLDLNFDKPIPKDLSPQDSLEVFFTLHESNQLPLWVDDIRVELWEPEE